MASNQARNTRSPSKQDSTSSTPTPPDTDDASLRLRARRIEEEIQRLHGDLIARKQVSGALSRDAECNAVELRLKLSATGKPAPGASGLDMDLELVSIEP